MDTGRPNSARLVARLGGAAAEGLRVLALLFGLLCAGIAGPFFLGAYAQGFETLDELRSRGSDGYPFRWQEALVIGLFLVLLSGAAALAVQTPQRRHVYRTAALGVVCLTVPEPLAYPTGPAAWLWLLGPMALAAIVTGLGRCIGTLTVAFPLAAASVAIGAIVVAEMREPSRPTGAPYPVATASAEVPAPPLPPVAHREFVAELRAAGAGVAEEPGDAIHPFFRIRGRTVRVNGERVSVFEYATAADAEAEAATVSADGRRDERIITTWAEPSHFFRRGSLIVVYTGDAPAVVDLLTRLLGPQFAGQ